MRITASKKECFYSKSNLATIWIIETKPNTDYCEMFKFSFFANLKCQGSCYCQSIMKFASEEWDLGLLIITLSMYDVGLNSKLQKPEVAANVS